MNKYTPYRPAGDTTQQQYDQRLARNKIAYNNNIIISYYYHNNIYLFNRK